MIVGTSGGSGDRAGSSYVYWGHQVFADVEQVADRIESAVRGRAASSASDYQSSASTNSGA